MGRSHMLKHRGSIFRFVFAAPTFKRKYFQRYEALNLGKTKFTKVAVELFLKMHSI